MLPPNLTAHPAAGRPFVLVIDSADRLAHGEDSDRVLRAMVDYARDWAQVGTTAG